jgi:hypothetical protein
MFKGYKRLKLLLIIIKAWNNQHNPLGETVFKPHRRQESFDNS